MAIVADAREVACQIEAHALAFVQAAVFVVEPFIEEADVDAEDPRDLEQAPRRHAVDAALVLVGLLVGHADHLRELLLSEPQHCAALTDALADILLDALDSCRNCFHSISPFQLGVAPRSEEHTSELQSLMRT